MSTAVGFAAGLGGMPAPVVAYLPRAYYATLTPAAVLTITGPEQTFTVTGLSMDDNVNVSPPGHTANCPLCSARVTAADTIGIAWVNPTTGSLTPPSGTYKIIATKCV